MKDGAIDSDYIAHSPAATAYARSLALRLFSVALTLQVLCALALPMIGAYGLQAMNPAYAKEGRIAGVLIYFGLGVGLGIAPILAVVGSGLAVRRWIAAATEARGGLLLPICLNLALAMLTWGVVTYMIIDDRISYARQVVWENSHAEEASNADFPGIRSGLQRIQQEHGGDLTRYPFRDGSRKIHCHYVLPDDHLRSGSFEIEITGPNSATVFIDGSGASETPRMEVTDVRAGTYRVSIDQHEK
jgi:hypothetical protein